MKLSKPTAKELAGIRAATSLTGFAVPISGAHSMSAAPVRTAGAGQSQSVPVGDPPDDGWP